MNPNEPVSGRQLAKMLGQTEGGVRRAVERQSIVEGKTADGKFIPAIASVEWGKEILPEFLVGTNTPVIPKPKAAVIKKPVGKPAKVRMLKAKTETDHVPGTAAEVVAEAMAEPTPRLSKKELAAVNDDAEPDDHEAGLGDEQDENEGKMTKVEAERRASVLKTKILRLAYMEKRGQMVPIAKVNQVLFGYGAEIRNAIEGIPNRCLDKVLGAKSRHEAKKFFEREIYETLNLLADIAGRELK